MGAMVKNGITRQQRVLETLRREIVGGKYPPGGQLPVQTKLTARFGVGSSTIAQALAVLGREGFVNSRRGAGCTVCLKPPHLNNIVVAVPNRHLVGSHWSNYYASVTRVVSELRNETARPILLFEELEERLSRSYLELEELVRADRVAGIVFINPTKPLAGSLILEKPGIPRVAVSSYDDKRVGTRVEINGSFIEKAVDCLVGCGRRDIAVLTSTAGWEEEHGRRIRTVLASRKVNCPPRWRIPFNIETPMTVQNVVRLLMHGKDRPNGLIITDDNLVEDAVAGLVAEGVEVPVDLEVVAHCNFPWPPLKTYPFRRLGPDVRGMLLACIDAIDKARRGEPAPVVIESPAIWESDIPPALDAAS